MSWNNKENKILGVVSAQLSKFKLKIIFYRGSD
jgi:hypothetical protein